MTLKTRLSHPQYDEVPLMEVARLVHIPYDVLLRWGKRGFIPIKDSQKTWLGQEVMMQADVQAFEGLYKAIKRYLPTTKWKG